MSTSLGAFRTSQNPVEGPARTRPDLPPPPDERVERDPLGRLLPKIEIPPDAPEASTLAGGTIEIRAFRFSGNSAFSDEELASITDPYVGEGRRYSALLEARDRITRAYIDAGYISSGAVLPAQSLADGVVEIETAVGNDRAGLGFAGSAIRAGARSALGRLWPIADQTAQELMVDFYERLQTNRMTKAEALQQAQASLRTDEHFEHPYYGAPFTLVNDWL